MTTKPSLRERIPLPAIALLALVLAAAFAVMSLRPDRKREAEAPPHPSPPTIPAVPDSMNGDVTEVESPVRFTSMSKLETGIDFVYYGSPSQQHYMTEQNGGGAAILDFDADGQLDLFLVNGSHFQDAAEDAEASHRLFRQVGRWRFDDVTTAAGLRAFGFGQGCAAADYNNDGFCDLFVAQYGTNRLWRNNGDGTFTEVTQAAGVGDDRWATSAAFADLDGDGDLELYVVNYVDWTPASVTGKRIPSPMDFNGLPDELYDNRGEGTFAPVGDDAGIAVKDEGKGLAVAIGDLDGDRRPDVYVANDTTRNFLFRNLGGLRFEEVGVPRGVAVSQDGSIGSSMGIALGDYNRDGRPDLFVTNFSQEVVDAFTNVGPAGFAATNSELGIDSASRRLLNFGIVLADFDADTWPDLFFANGHLWDEEAAGWEYKMPPKLLRNVSGEKFADESRGVGDYFRNRWLGRAVAWGDLDNDGDADLVVTHLEDAAAVLRNDSRRSGRAVQLRLIGTRSSRQPLGARVEVLVNEQRLVSHVPSGESFQASHDDRVLVAVGDSEVVDEVRVVWPGGGVERWTNVATDHLVTLIEGTGEIVPTP